jgi:hypothetical protein
VDYGLDLCIGTNSNTINEERERLKEYKKYIDTLIEEEAVAIDL